MLQELKSPNSRFGKFDEKVEETIRGGFAASTNIPDHVRGSGTAQPVDRGRKNIPGFLPPKPQAKPKPQSEPTGTSKTAINPGSMRRPARQRAVVLKKDFPGIKNVPQAISKSQRRNLIAHYEATDATSRNDERKIPTRSQHTSASAATSSRINDLGRTVAAQLNTVTVLRGSGGASTSDPIEID